MIIGGQAVLLYGEPRLTRDIDVTIGVGLEKLKMVKQIIKELKLNPLVKDVDKFVKKTLVIPLEERETGIKVDFIFSYSNYEREAIKRAKKVKIGKCFVKFARVEDLLIHKIIAGRPRDIEDARVIILKNSKITKNYIKKWLKYFDSSLNTTFLKTFYSLLEK